MSLDQDIMMDEARASVERVAVAFKGGKIPRLGDVEVLMGDALRAGDKSKFRKQLTSWEALCLKAWK
jgi:hypothetical protein